MHRARDPHWIALCLATLVSIAACDHDDDGTTASDAGDESADDDSNEGEGDLAPLTCMDLTCPADHVCVEPRPYCDLTGDEPELRQDPAECRPKDTVPRMAECDDLQGVLVPGPDGQPVMECPEDEIPCG